MAGSSLLLLLDDIAAVLDDVSVMTKVAAKKTAGVLGDDLAVNAEKVTGVRAERELPVVWAVARGSFLNKLILVPLALLASAFAPWLITPALIAGGLYLCFEGSEKLLHKFLHGREQDAERARRIEAVAHEEVDLVEYERSKIKGAIRTDFILSAEIIVLTLGVVAGADFITQVGVLSGIAIVMTVGVYGLVAGIVKLDDAGMYLYAREGEGLWPGFLRWLGQGLISFAPWLMKALGVIGTIAMFMVGGSILLHNVHALGAGVESFAQVLPPWLALVTPTLAGMLLGFFAGAVIVFVVEAVRKLRA